ncbi:MAG: toll/interleukin-1 receptor domain-containing protein, partial [Thiolinea sp.]
MNSPYIFLSHKSEDKPQVRQLATMLEQHPLAKQNSIKVWLDERSQDNTQTYVSQFSRAIVSPRACAFLLFVPKDSTDGYVQHEIETAFNRRMNDEKQGNKFPIFPVYPAGQAERIKLPHPIQGFNYFENILENSDRLTDILEGALVLNSKTTSRGGDIGVGPDQNKSPGWLCYILETSGEAITAENFYTYAKTSIPKNQLLPLDRSEDQSATLEQLFPDLCVASLVVERLRIMTDDAELAVLPWSKLQTDAVVEVSPVARRYPEAFDDNSALISPLAVIPQDAKHGIAGNKHYSALVGYFNSHLGMRGPLPRVTSVQSLGRELKQHQPDFIYLYGCFDGQSIVLDKPDSFAPGESGRLTLTEFGEWLKSALDHKAMIRPIVVLSLVGGVLNEYPAELVKHCKVLWIQSVRMRGSHPLIESQLAQALEALSANHGDLIKAINQQSDKRVNSHLWVNGQPIRFDTHNGMPLSSQLRAALLRVMLGRDNLKAMLRDRIDRPEHRSGGSFLVYAVTGDAASCPFEVPQQLQSRLDWEDQEKGLPVIPLYFSLKVDPDSDA